MTSFKFRDNFCLDRDNAPDPLPSHATSVIHTHRREGCLVKVRLHMYWMRKGCDEVREHGTAVHRQIKHRRRDRYSSHSRGVSGGCGPTVELA